METVSGQDVRFHQLTAAALQMNPANAGNALVKKDRSVSRISMGYQTDRSMHERVSYGSYDKRLKGISGAIGFFAQYQRIYNGLLTIASIKGIYNRHLWVSGRSRLSIAVQPGIENKYVDLSRTFLTPNNHFFSRINPVYYDSIHNNMEPTDISKTYFTLGGGILFSHPDYSIGIGVQNINQPNWAITKGVKQIKPMQLNLHGKVRLFKLRNYFSSDQNKLELQALASTQGGDQWAMLGLNARKSLFSLGVSYIYKNIWAYKGHGCLINAGIGNNVFNFNYGVEIQSPSSRQLRYYNHSLSLLVTPAHSEKPLKFKPISTPAF